MIVKLRVPTQKFIEKVGDYVPERAAIIDRRLAAPRTPMSLQLRAAILAMCERLLLRFASAEKSPPTRWRLFNCGDRRIAQDKFFQVIGHTSARLQKPFCEVYGLIQDVNEQALPTTRFISSQSLH
jgi:hypothetical protein